MNTKAVFIIVTALTLFVFVSPIYADEMTYSESDAFSESVDEYIPEYVDEVLSDKALDVDNISPNDILKQCIESFIDAISDNDRYLLMIIVVVVVNSIAKQIIRTNNSPITSLLSKLSLLYVIIDYFLKISNNVSDCISELNKLLDSLIPTFAAVHLLSGASYSAVASSASVATLSGVVGKLFGDNLPSITYIVLCIFVFERLSPQLRKTGLANSIKKSLISVIVFTFSTMVSLMTVSGSLASAKDSAALKTMRFAASNIVPIIGSSVSEALKTVSAGVTYMKAYMCAASAYALLVITLPSLLELFCFKLILKVSAMISGAISSDDIDIFEGASGVADILIALVVAITVSVFLLLLLFSNFTLSAAI